MTTLPRRIVRALALSPLLLAPATPARAAQDPKPAAPAAHVEKVEKRGLTLTLPPIEALEPTGAVGGQVERRWKGKLGASKVDLQLVVLPREKYGLSEPFDVVDLLLGNFQDPKQGGRASYAFEEQRTVSGPFGYVSYAALARGPVDDPQSTKPKGVRWLLGGLLEQDGYLVRVEVEPAPSDADAKRIVEFLEKGIVHEGAKLDPKWSDQEAVERWQRDAPAKTHDKFEGAIRTKHYLILSNSSGADTFAKKVEECYDKIRATFPFEEVPGRRLMPIFLFRTPDEYYEFMAKATRTTIEAARKSKGHAYRDYYATWYEAPNDPVHIHELTHQIFGNRLYLSGGGSWLQEGVAEYVECSKNDLNPAAGQVGRNRHVPLVELMKAPSLLYSAGGETVTGTNDAGDQYKQAAVLIEFLRESKATKKRFLEFLHAVGKVRRNDLEAIEATVQRIYETDVAGLEKLWIEYCKKR